VVKECIIQTLPWTGGSDSILTGRGSGKKTDDPYREEKRLAKKSDVAIVVLGVNKSIEMEGRDRSTIDLPIDQQLFIKEIFKANPKTIVILVAGSSLAINWIQENVPAVVNAWYPGEQGGNAIADVLFGDYNPAGRLPLTYYKSTEDLPAFDDYEVFNGRTYMYFDKKPLYAFGYGLSYTSFNYSNIRADKSSIGQSDTISINIDIKNSGKVDGDEVVQLYLQKKASSFKMPIRQLKAFKRISLKTGETKTVSFTLCKKDLAYWNNNNEFVLEPGEMNVQIGASSDDIRQEIKFKVINLVNLNK
jgi:beta-glucosidase